jgi:TorA maturation chaperone TorD
MRDRIELLIAHKLAYSFLSQVFYEPPSKTQIDTLAAEALFDAWPLETGQAEVETGLDLLRQFCASWSGDNLEALECDYRKLFVGPGHLLAAPWESVYRSPDHLLFDLHTSQVRRAYQRFGMAIPHLGSEPEDHLGLELRFVAHLCALGLESLGADQADVLDKMIAETHNFVSGHLLQWAPDCLHLVVENAASDYYRGCAHLALGCLMHTNEVLHWKRRDELVNLALATQRFSEG